MNKQIEEIAVLGCGRTPQAYTKEECMKCPFDEKNCMAKRHAKALLPLIKQYQVQAIKEFAKKLREDINIYFSSPLNKIDIYTQIGKTLKEFIGEEK